LRFAFSNEIGASAPPKLKRCLGFTDHQNGSGTQSLARNRQQPCKEP
jgi:hypothetical protein